MVRRWRLLPEHVDAGPGERAIAQRFHERAMYRERRRNKGRS